MPNSIRVSLSLLSNEKKEKRRNLEKEKKKVEIIKNLIEVKATEGAEKHEETDEEFFIVV